MSASTREFSLMGGWSRRSVVAERIPSEGSEGVWGLGSEVGERLGESAVARRAWRAWWRGDSGHRGSVESSVRTVYTHARCGRRGRGCHARVSSAAMASDRALACDSRARSEALASARGKCASDSSSIRVCKPSHTRVIRSRVLPYL